MAQGSEYVMGQVGADAESARPARLEQRRDPGTIVTGAGVVAASGRKPV